MKIKVRVAAIASLLVLTSPFVQAQPAPNSQRDFWPGTGVMMGPGMMSGRAEFAFLCSPRAAGLAEWRLDSISKAVKPTEAQQVKLNDLREASKKAAESVQKACPRTWPGQAPARLALMETRMEVMIQAIKTIRPAFDAFYETLDADQKARLDGAGPRRWGWGWWRRQ